MIFVSSRHDKIIFVFRTSDGELKQRVRTDSAPIFIACNPQTRSVYVSLELPFNVARYVWDEGTGLAYAGIVESAGTADGFRPVAVMPPAPEKITSYLIIGKVGTPCLRVLALPGHESCFEHTIEGRPRVVGIAADPWGTALVVCCCGGSTKTDEVLVIPWPFEGLEIT